MSIVRDSLPILNSARALLSDVGLRPYTVSLLVTTWSGAAVGQGTRSQVETPLTVANGRPPKVRQMSAKEIVAQGGTLEDQIFEVGPLTPSYAGGGTDAALINPPVTGSPTEVHFLLRGPGIPATGTLCQKVFDRLDSPFRLMFQIRRIGVNP